MRGKPTRRSLLATLAAGSFLGGVPRGGRANRLTDAGPSDFDPAVHGFGFANWSTGDGRFPAHDHETVSESQVERAIERTWRGPLERLFGVAVSSLPSELLETIATQLYVSANQQSATNGHCYGMVFAAQQYFEQPNTIPLDRSAAREFTNPSEPLDDASGPVGEEIDLYQATQLLNPNVWVGRRMLNWPSAIDYRRQLADLQAVVAEFATAGITLFDSKSRLSHQVLVYDTRWSGETARLSVYDPNRPADGYTGDPLTVELDLGSPNPVSYARNPEYDHFLFNRLDRIVAAQTGPAGTTASEPSISLGRDPLRIGLFLLDTDGVELAVIDPHGTPVGRDLATHMDRSSTEYHAMRYRYGIAAGDYRIALTGLRSTAYTLQIKVADRSGSLLDERIEGSIAEAEVHEFVVTIPEDAETFGEVERTDSALPGWLVALGGVGAAAAGTAAYRRLQSRDEK